MKREISRRQFNKLLAAVPITLPSLKALSFSTGKADDQVTEKLKLHYEPYRGHGSWQMPLKIDYVVEYVSDKFLKRRIGVQNLSSKPAKTMNLGFFLVDERYPGVVKLSFRSPNLELPGGLQPHALCELDGMDALDTVLKPVIKAENANVPYRIEVFANKVWYEDGSVWEYEKMESPSHQ